MSNKVDSIVVEVPITTAYNQWTQFEDFPRFMDAVESVTQVDELHNHWVVRIGGITREFDTKITEQLRDQRIAWRSVDGTTHAGVVTFHQLDPVRTKVMVQLDFAPEGLAEQIGDSVGLVESRIKADLSEFKEFIEERGRETGKWRGEVS